MSRRWVVPRSAPDTPSEELPWIERNANNRGAGIGFHSHSAPAWTGGIGLASIESGLMRHSATLGNGISSSALEQPQVRGVQGRSLGTGSGLGAHWGVAWRLGAGVLVLVLVLGLLGSACVKSVPISQEKQALARAPVFKEATGKASKSLGALRISDESQLIGGPAATGRVGDILIYNDRVKFIVDAVDRPFGFAQSGGNLIDADEAAGGNDQLAQVFTYLENTFPRQFVYSSLVITQNGSTGNMVEVVVTGVDSREPSVVGVTRYQLERGASWLRILTEVYNFGSQNLRSYEVGDSLQWGLAEHYVPGHGTQVSGRTTTSAWVAGVGEGVSYGMGLLAAPLVGPHGNGWTDVIGGRVNLGREGMTSYERYFFVGNGDTASLTQAFFKLRDENVELCKGRVVESGTRKPVLGARIEARLSSNGKPMGFALTNSEGRFALELPASEYRLLATHRSRASREPIEADLTRMSGREWTLELTPPARLLFRIAEADGTAMPGRLTFEGLNGTPDPELGHKAGVPGALNAWFSLTGQGELELPPGDYRVTASRGIEYGIKQASLTLKGGKEESFVAALAREVDTGGYVSADFNQHSSFSDNSWVQPEAMVTANLAEGVEIVAATDTNTVSDFLPLLQKLGMESRLKILTGQEITTRQFGTMATFPMEPRSDKPGNGALIPGSQEPGALFEALLKDGEPRVIQINQPREGEEGYFNLLQLDPQTAVPGDPRFSFGFNTLEVFSGKRMKDASNVLRDWFLLLNKGYAFTATGNSDSRTVVTQERGYPRNYLGIFADNPGRIGNDAVVAAVREDRNVMVTNGPFVRVTANGKAAIGSIMTVKEETPGAGAPVKLEIEVQAASWVGVDELEVVANGEVVRRIEVTPPPTGAEPNRTFPPGRRYQGTVELNPTRDTWYVVIARGSQGMEPVLPRYKGTTITPFGFTNPIWIDVDGDGDYQPLFPRDKNEAGYREIPKKKVE